MERKTIFKLIAAILVVAAAFLALGGVIGGEDILYQIQNAAGGVI